jgi:RNA recognition motif-containing protein
MKNLENACGYYQRYYQRPHQDNDPKKPPLYWDGYQWVIRPSTFTEQNFDVIKPGRKIIIANLPLHMNLLVNHLKDYIIKSALEKNIVSKKELKENNDIIRTIELDMVNNSAIISMENIEFAKRMVLLDGIILLGHTLRISAYQDISTDDVNCSNITKASALANTAHLSAKSAAIAYAAFQNYSKNDNIKLNLEENNMNMNISSKFIKVINACDHKDAIKYDYEKFEEILLDMKEQFMNFGDIVSCCIIKPKQEKLGAECGSVFIEFQDCKSAELVMKQIKHKRYLGREIKVAYINEEVYKKEIMS